MFNFEVKGSLTVRGDTVELSGTPTTTVRLHFIRALYDGTQLSTINKLALVDTGGTERDYTTSLTYNVVGGALQIQGTITITASYTVARIRSYSGTNLYFDTTLSEAKSVSSGDTVSATVTITFSMTGSLSNYAFVADQVAARVYDVFRGTSMASALNISTVRIYLYNVNARTTTYYNLTPTKTLGGGGSSVTFTVSTTPDFDWESRNVEIYAGATRLWYWNLTGTPTSGSAGTTLQYTETTSA